MHLNTTTDPDKATVLAEWADVLIRDTQLHLGRMDTTLTLAEAKVALVRRMIERRRVWELDRPVEEAVLAGG